MDVPESATKLLYKSQNFAFWPIQNRIVSNRLPFSTEIVPRQGFASRKSFFRRQTVYCVHDTFTEELEDAVQFTVELLPFDSCHSRQFTGAVTMPEQRPYQPPLRSIHVIDSFLQPLTNV